MPLTDADICNLALGRVGERQTLLSLNANTTQAKACKVVYEAARDALLEVLPWPFATRHAQLALLEDHTVTQTTIRNAFTYVYAIPADCLPGGWRYIWAGITNPPPDRQPAFEVEDDATNGLVLLTNMKQAELVYTRKVTETVKFTPLFIDALSWRIAYELTFSIPVKPQVAERMIQGAQRALEIAAASVFNHQLSMPKPRASGVRARGGPDRWQSPDPTWNAK